MDPFPFVLALALGMTLAELDARVSWDEFWRWRAFWSWRAWKEEQAAAAARLRAQ